MAELLSKAQYAAIAADLQLRTQAFIDGEFRDAVSGRTFVTSNPATGKQLAEVAACDVNDVNVAVAAAKRVFEEGTWSKMQPNDRKHVLQKFAQLLEDNAHELAVLEALDSGQLSGAVLDVLQEEPAPADHPFWDHPQILLTPHIAAMTQPQSAFGVLLDNIRRFERGEPMVGQIDREQGY